MAINEGIAPPDPETPIGQVRLLSGDSVYTELDPPVAGMGQYRYWSDAEIASFLTLAGGSIPRAISIAYSQLASSYVGQSRSIKTDDLSISASTYMADWIRLVDYWRDIADSSDANAVDDIFDAVGGWCTGDFIFDDDCNCGVPEATARPVMCGCR